MTRREDAHFVFSHSNKGFSTGCNGPFFSMAAQAMSGGIKNIKDESPCETTITHLEKLLEDAKAGKLRTIVTVCGWDDDCVTSGWSWDRRNSIRRIVAETLILQHDLVNNLGIYEGDSILAGALRD